MDGWDTTTACGDTGCSFFLDSPIKRKAGENVGVLLRDWLGNVALVVLMVCLNLWLSVSKVY